MNLFPEAGLVGGLGGGGLGALLGQVGDVLSAPRRFAWKLAGLGDRGGADVVSDVTGGDSDSVLSHVLGFGLEALTDPLTWVGGLGGRLLGGKAGGALSSAAERAGPGYSADVGKLFGGLENLESGTAQRLLRQPNDVLHAAAAELPEGSSFLGMGGEGIAYRTPQGNVVRMEAGLKGLPEGRAVAPEVLQPARSVSSGNVRVEHLPLVGTQDAEYAGALGRAGVDPRRGMNFPPGLGEELEGIDRTWQQGSQALRESARQRGLEVLDSNTGQNLGRTAEGKWLTFDPGLFEPGPGSGVPVGNPTPLGGGGLTSWLARVLGGQGRLRSALERPFSTAGQGI